MLLDMTGRTIIVKELPEINGEENIHIPTSHLPNGAYIIYVQTNEATYKTRLIVSH